MNVSHYFFEYKLNHLFFNLIKKTSHLLFSDELKLCTQNNQPKKTLCKTFTSQL